MKHIPLTLLACVATAAVAAETREMAAHVHGVSTLELAIEHGHLELNLLSPGADIVGFEYTATSDADKDAVEDAIRKLLVPENIVALPKAAECRLTEVLAHLHSGDHHHGDEDGHDHDDHDHDHAEGEDHDHDHDKEHAEGEDHDHDHDKEHAEGEDHAHEHDHEDGDHHDHEDGAEHSEFHVGYAFECAHEEKLTEINFPFFATFANAQKIDAQYVTETAAGSAEVTRDAAKLSLN